MKADPHVTTCLPIPVRPSTQIGRGVEAFLGADEAGKEVPVPKTHVEHGAYFSACVASSIPSSTTAEAGLPGDINLITLPVVSAQTR